MNDYNRQSVKLIDEFLFEKVRQRLGLSAGEVVIQTEEWDLGFCETCSYPEYGFAVYVDDELVWPNDEILSALGGYIYADNSGTIINGELSTYGYFFDWLDGKDLEALADADDRASWESEKDNDVVSDEDYDFGEEKPSWAK